MIFIQDSTGKHDEDLAKYWRMQRISRVYSQFETVVQDYVIEARIRERDWESIKERLNKSINEIVDTCKEDEEKRVYLTTSDFKGKV